MFMPSLLTASGSPAIFTLQTLSSLPSAQIRHARVKHVEHVPIPWRLAFPQNMVHSQETGGLLPQDRTGWHNGAEGLPLAGDFEIEYAMKIGTCNAIGSGDFLVGYTLVDPDSANIVTHGWNEDDNAIFLLFDQGCELQSAFGKYWEDYIFLCTDIGDTVTFNIRRTAEITRYRIHWKGQIFQGIIQRDHTGLVWPVAAFFRKGSHLLYASIVSGQMVTPIKRNPNTIWILLVVSLFVLGGLLYLRMWIKYRKRIRLQRAQIREQELILRSKEAVENERNRIASEMHDDLGAGLTTIRFLSDKALKQARDGAEAEQIRRIAEHSHQLVRNMSEIIWAMNARFDNAESLTAYLRRYASEYLDEHGIPMQFQSDDSPGHEIPITGEKRRNLFLVFKEMLHNTVKHSGATSVIIEVALGESYQIIIREMGARGFSPENADAKGNGLFNCRKRMDMVGGSLSFKEIPGGHQIEISLPLAVVGEPLSRNL